MSKGSRGAAESAAARLCEWRWMNCYVTYAENSSASRKQQGKSCPHEFEPLAFG
ncbi:MAG: hypothetical protein Q4C60_00325 [Eubacteriales bacterium]|nr:hypothetical protein [Eubacteriales bacterium]